jgi:hypothetical protein
MPAALAGPASWLLTVELLLKRQELLFFYEGRLRTWDDARKIRVAIAEERRIRLLYFALRAALLFISPLGLQQEFSAALCLSGFIYSRNFCLNFLRLCSHTLKQTLDGKFYFENLGASSSVGTAHQIR